MSEKFDPGKFLATLSQRPGVYRMIDADGRIIYVGKARNLRNRVASYFGSKAHHPKTQALMNHTDHVEVTVTATEPEALLLEFNLIKAHQPRFNVLLRDDKSYPYIRLTQSQQYPRFEFHRGRKSAKDRYFGPFPSAGAVRQTLGQLQKLFQVRQCSDSYFRHRSRPCLQHQIKRCTAPCVGLISPEEYARDVTNSIHFLQGRNDSVLADLQQRMDRAAAALNYEIAAQYRDQIASIKDVQARQSITGSALKNTDVLAVTSEQGMFCIALLMVRSGRMLGSRHFFPKTAPHTDPAEVLSAFIAQHYFSRHAPPEILINIDIDDGDLLEAALSEQAGRSVAIRRRVRSHRKRWVDMALENARQALLTHRASGRSLRQQFTALTELLQLDDLPERIECFDISHTGGAETVAACRVRPRGADQIGLPALQYPGHRTGRRLCGDRAGRVAALQRLKKEEAVLPDLVLIDGGRGQLDKAVGVFEELQLNDVLLVGVAKGQGRKAGRERLFVAGRRRSLPLAGDTPAAHLIQQIRDEAHRFAITAHRQRRGKAQQQSTLDSIPGLGPARRKALLKAFGGLQGVRRAGVDDLMTVRGISRALADRIYDRLHGGH